MARLPAAGAFRSLQSDDAAHDLPDFGTEPVEVPDGATLPPTPPDWVGRDPERSLPVVRVAERSEDSTSSVLDGMAEAADAAGQDAPESEPENSPTTFRDRLRAARERTGVRDEPGAPDIVAPRSSNLPAAIEAFIEGSAREHAAERRAGERAAVEASSAATGIPQSLRDLAARHGIQDPDRRLGEMDQATARALSAASDPRWWAELLRAVPEGAIDIGATTMRGAAVLGPIEAIATSVDRYRADILAVPGLSDAQVLELRQQVAREWGTRSPAVAAAIQHAITEMRAGTLTPESFAERYPPATPVQDRPLYRAGEATSAMGRQLLPAQPGYEQAVSRQLGHSLGSLLAGLPIAYFLGPVGGGTFFGMAGVGEATQRAVQFDQAERAAGREGLTQEQIILAGLLGVGPGATDIAPIEVMLGRLKLPGMTPQISRTIAQAIGRAGGRIFVQAGVEGGQEGLQQFLQNLISWSTYNPGQDLTDDVLRSFGLGTGVGGIAQAGRELGGGAIRLARRGGRGSASDGHPPAADAPPAPQQRPQTEPPLQPDGAGAPTAPAADAGVVSDDPYNLERFGGPVPETAAPAESEQSSAQSQRETDPAAAVSGSNLTLGRGGRVTGGRRRLGEAGISVVPDEEDLRIQPAPEVQSVLDGINRRDPERYIAITSEGEPVAGETGRRPQPAWQQINNPNLTTDDRRALIGARLDAQARLGIPGYRQRIVTRAEADSLLQMPADAQMTDGVFRENLRSAAARAIELYGPQHGRRALVDAMSFRQSSDTRRRIATSLLSQFSEGDAMTAEGLADMAEMLDIDRRDALWRFGAPGDAAGLPRGPTPGAAGQRALDVMAASEGDLGAPWAPSDRPSIGPQFTQTGPNPFAGVSVNTTSRPPIAPTAEEIEELRRSPEFWQEFDSIYGVGAAARALGRPELRQPPRPRAASQR